MPTNPSPFSLQNLTAVLIGGGGAIGSALALGMAAAGANTVICDLSLEKAKDTASLVRKKGVQAEALEVNALDRASIESAAESVLRTYGQIDILVNLAGGNLAEASTSPDRSFFDLPLSALERTIALNLFAGAILPAQIFGKHMVKNSEGGSIINTASMNAIRPLTRIPAYSAAKAAVANFTQWLAVHLAQEYSPTLRVNAIAPGFFLTDQNRYLLLERDSGELTERGKTIIAHTPMGRIGEPEDLAGAAVWLASPASKFVTGIVLPIDGGFSAFSGV
ncbi:MAG: SDR family oxidoreductase [bacterium]|nr:SDR family oxidoreductase [bacterium]